MNTIPTDLISKNLLNDLIKTKVHLGTMKWTKTMSPYLFGYRNKIAIFNLERIVISIKQALKVLYGIKQKKGHILFVNTSPKYKELVQITASTTNQSYINDRWVGGMLTNWKQLSQSVFLFQKFVYQFDSFLQSNNIQIPSYQKAKKRYEGLKQPSSYNNSKMEIQLHKNTIKQVVLPDIIILTNPEKNAIVIQEAQKFQIPIIAFMDSNSKNENIQFLIPGNNQSISFMYFCFNLFTITLKRNKTIN
jgi:small subunit ribosomal protein S2